MALRLTINGVDYTKHLVPTVKPQYTDELNKSKIFTFALYPADSTFNPVTEGGRVRFFSDSKVISTGYITATPNREIVAPGYSGYNVITESDDWNFTSQYGDVEEFVGRYAGDIFIELLHLANADVDTSKVPMGIFVPRFSVQPQWKFSDAAQALANQIGWRWQILDGIAYFSEQNDTEYGYDADATSSDFNSPSFTITNSNIQLVNDATVFGSEEPADFFQDNYLGDGLNSGFEVSNAIYLNDTEVQFSDGFYSSILDTRRWKLTDPTGAFSYESQNVAIDGDKIILQAKNGFELGGELKFYHGKMLFDNLSNGVVGGLYAGSTCVAGFGCTAATVHTGLQPIVNGQKVGNLFVTLPTHSYKLYTYVSVDEKYRYNESFRSINGNFGGNVISCGAFFTFVVVDVDEFGTETTTILYDDRVSDIPAFATYQLVNSAGMTMHFYEGPMIESSPYVRVRSSVHGRVNASVSSGSVTLDYIPTNTEQIKITYRAKNTSKARLSNPNLNGNKVVLASANLRTSADCENILQAYLSDHSRMLFEGYYTTSEVRLGKIPVAGRYMSINYPSVTTLFSSVVRKSVITFADLVAETVTVSSDYGFAPYITSYPTANISTDVPVQKFTEVPTHLQDIAFVDVTNITGNTITINCGRLPNFKYDVCDEYGVAYQSFEQASFTIPRSSENEIWMIYERDGGNPAKLSRNPFIIAAPNYPILPASPEASIQVGLTTVYTLNILNAAEVAGWEIRRSDDSVIVNRELSSINKLPSMTVTYEEDNSVAKTRVYNGIKFYTYNRRGEYSAPLTVSVSLPVPAAPTLGVVAINQQNVSLEISSDPRTDIVRQVLEVSNQEGVADPIFIDDRYSQFIASSCSLSGGGTFYAHVRRQDALGWGDYSDTITFDVPIDSAMETAEAAAAAAAAAQTNAQAALNQLQDISNDDLLTPNEKPPVKLDYDTLIAEQSGIDAQATSFSITTEKAAYDNAITALTNYLATLTTPKLWSDFTGDTNITPAGTFRQKFQDTYITRQALLNKIYASAKTLADTANAELQKIGSDNWLSKGEKPNVITQANAILNEYGSILAQADDLGVDSSSYQDRYSELFIYLDGLDPSYSDTTTDTPIVATTWQQAWVNYYSARGNVLYDIANQQNANTNNAATTAAIAANKVTNSTTLPVAGSYTGRYVFLTAVDGLNQPGLYYSNGTTWSREKITASMLVDQIIAGQIAAGVVGASEISANAITAKHMNITDFTNICGNPCGDSGVDGWSGFVTSASAPSLSSKNALLQNNRDAYYGTWFPVTAGDVYRLSVDAYPDTVTPPTADFQVGLSFKTDSGTQSWAYIGLTSRGTAGWRTYEGQVTVPVGCTTAVIWTNINGTVGSTGRWYFRNLIVNKAANASLLVDGSIKAAKINISDMVTNGINAGSTQIDPGKIKVSSGSLADWQYSGSTTIDGGKIQADTITAAKLNIAARGVDPMGIKFSTSNNTLSWSSGQIYYTDNSGSYTGSTVSSGSCTYSGNMLYVYWVIGATSLSYTTNYATATANNVVRLGLYNGGTAFYATYGRTEITGDYIKTGTITAGNLAAGTIKTTNYAEDSGGNPTAGAKLDTTGTALKVVSGGFQIGTQLFTDYWIRLLNALDGGSASGVLIYRGNVNTTIRGGAPDANCLHLYPVSGGQTASNSYGSYTWNIEIRPSAQGVTDGENLDSLRFVRMQLFSSTSAGAPFMEPLYFPVSDRLYRGGTTTGADNSSWVTANVTMRPQYFYASSPYLYNGCVRLTLFNAYGPSADKDFSPTNTAGGECATTTINGAPPSGGGGGGPTGGGGCPAPWVKITLASGLKVNAADLYNGAKVVGVNDVDFSPAVGEIEDLQTIWRQRYAIEFSDGSMAEYSGNHRFGVVERGWIKIQDVKPGDRLMSQIDRVVTKVYPTCIGEVISFRVKGCSTYFSNDDLSHNTKALPGDGSY